jgi:alcohol dehydrogenase
MADYCTLPRSNLYPVEDWLDDRRAVFVEPLAAACAVNERLGLCGDERVLVLGDGKLGILCAWVLSTLAGQVTLCGHHPEKLELAAWRGLQTIARSADFDGDADIVVDATGSATGFMEAAVRCRPRGTVVLKTTVADSATINLAPVVVKELQVIGSRCGRFEDALAFLRAFPDLPLERLISGCYPLDQAEAAFARAAERDSLKVLLAVS